MALAEICGFYNFYKNKKNEESTYYTNTMVYKCPTGGKSGSVKVDTEHGTTTLGFVYQGGIVLAVDSRATFRNDVVSQTMEKVVAISGHLLGTIAGTAGDCVFWDRMLSKQCRLYELRHREPISVAAASKLMTSMFSPYKGMELNIGMILAGWDKRGPHLYYLDSDGTRTSGRVFACGSGAVYAYGVLDTGYRWELPDQEAFELGRRSIYHATFRDTASGGIVRVYHMQETEWAQVSMDDCKDLHYRYQQEKIAETAPT